MYLAIFYGSTPPLSQPKLRSLKSYFFRHLIQGGRVSEQFMQLAQEQVAVEKYNLDDDSIIQRRRVAPTSSLQR